MNHFDESIPVLTEVVPDKPTAPESAAVPGAFEDIESHAADVFGEHEWQALERRLAERVLNQLQGRVDFVLEQRLRDSMAEVLQHALAGLTSEIRVGLQQTIEQIVVRAVAQEVAHLKTLK